MLPPSPEAPAPPRAGTAASLRGPVLILHTGDPDEAGRTLHGDYATLLRRTAGLAPEEAETVAVFRGETPAEPSSYAAALVTGSPAMVTDRLPWSERAAAWLREAAGQGLPIFGICYGHQLLAHALGGEVAYNPLGREIGTREVSLVPAAREDALLAGLPSRFPAQMQHSQTVAAPPPGARTLASSALDAHQILRYGPAVVSTQFHPEFDAALVRSDLRRHAARYAGQGLDPAALERGVRPTPEAAGLPARFLALYARRGVSG